MSAEQTMSRPEPTRHSKTSASFQLRPQSSIGWTIGCSERGRRSRLTARARSTSSLHCQSQLASVGNSASAGWWASFQRPSMRLQAGLMSPAWSRMLGLWNDAHHPALAEFPTEASCDWQWSELVDRARAVNLDRLPRSLQPIVQPIDDWGRNWKLGLVFECRVGSGRLMVCSADIANDLGTRPVARQLRRSLLDYMAGPKFLPKTAVAAEVLRGLWFDSHIMRHLGATTQADGVNASAAIDGDPNTYWSVGIPL